MEWNVYIYDMNARRVKIHNIFDHHGFLKDCKEALDKYDDKEGFVAEVRSSLMYYYWSKSEWEIEISDIFSPNPRYPSEKVDVYDQVMLNWKAFSDYLWNNREELRRFTFS